ncbi:MAG: hypothetical protein Q4G44_02640 [Alcaligenaceae bacterium]|nr:hypothetical protein [Alcaligenaceae bacterium]
MKKIIYLLKLFFLSSLLMVAATTVSAQPKADVKTLFQQLPEIAFQFLPSNNPAELERYINVNDPRHGFLSLELPDGDTWEMTHWNLKNGDKLVAVSVDWAYIFFHYHKGQMTLTNQFGLEQIDEDIGSSEAWNNFDNALRFSLPRRGTSLYFDLNGMIPLVYQWHAERFVRVEAYPPENPTEETLIQGFISAVKAKDIDRSIQYLLPSYVSAQGMKMYEGDLERLVCEILNGQDAQGNFITPNKFTEFKAISYRPETKTFHVELNSGQSYQVEPTLQQIEIRESRETPDDPPGKLLKTIPFLVGAVG